jgi:HAD superfamily hydrolase (TIGR01509 family)
VIFFGQIAGILWDLDGVLADTGELHYKAMVSVLAPHKISFPREIYNQTFGTNITNILTMTLGHPPSSEFVQKIMRMQGAEFCNAIKGQLVPLPGVIDTLEYFRKRGFQQAIASSSVSHVIQAVIDEIGIKTYFDAIISGAYLPPKPNPDVFLQAADAIKIPTKSCLVIEDAPAGLIGAQSAGMQTLAVTTSHPRSAVAMADMVVDDLSEFIDEIS